MPNQTNCRWRECWFLFCDTQWLTKWSALHSNIM